MPIIQPTNKLVRRTYTDEKGNNYYTTHTAAPDYETQAGERTDRFGRKYTESDYNPSAAGQIARGAAPSALGAAVGAMAGGLQGSVGAASGLGGVVNAAANVGANRLNAKYGGSKLAAVGAGALSTGASTFAKAFQSGVSRTGNLGSGLLSGLMGAGQGILQGGISAVPGGKTIGNSVGQIIGGGMSGGFGGAARGLSQGVMTSPTLGQDTANLLTKSNAGNYLENTWGKGMTSVEDENKQDAAHAEAGQPPQENLNLAPAQAPQGEPPAPQDVALPQGPNENGYGSIQEAAAAIGGRLAPAPRPAGMPPGPGAPAGALAPAPRPVGEPLAPAGDLGAGARPFAAPALGAAAPGAMPAAAAPAPPAMPAAAAPAPMPVAPPMAAGGGAGAGAMPPAPAPAPAPGAMPPAGDMAAAQQQFNNLYGTDNNPSDISNIELHREEAARLGAIQNPTPQQRQEMLLHRRRVGRFMHDAGVAAMARPRPAPAGAPAVPPPPGPGPAPLPDEPPPPPPWHAAPAVMPQGEPAAPSQDWLRQANRQNVMAPLPPPYGVTQEQLRRFNQMYGTPSNPKPISTVEYHRNQVAAIRRLPHINQFAERQLRLHEHRLNEYARRTVRQVRFAPMPAAPPAPAVMPAMPAAAAPAGIAATLRPQRGQDLRAAIRAEQEAEDFLAGRPLQREAERAQYLEDMPQLQRRPAVPVVPQFPAAGANIVRDEISPAVRNAFKQQYGDLDALNPQSTIENHQQEIERLEGRGVPLTELEQQRLTLHKNRLEDLQNRQDPFRNMPEDAYESPHALERLQAESARIAQARAAQEARPAQGAPEGVEGEEEPDIFSMNGDQLDQEIDRLDRQIDDDRLERGHKTAAEEVRDAAAARGVTDLDWQKNAMPIEHYITHPDNAGKYMQLNPTNPTSNFNDLPISSNFNVVNERNTMPLGERGERYFRTKFGPLRAYDRKSKDTNGSTQYKTAIGKFQSALLSGDDEKARQYYNDIHRYDRGVGIVGDEAVKNHAKILKDFSRQLMEHGNNPSTTPAELDAILEKAQQHMLTHIIGKTGLNGQENHFQTEVPEGDDRSLRQRYLDVELQHAIAKRNKEEAENRGWLGWAGGKARRMLNRVAGTSHNYFYPQHVANFMGGRERDLLGELPHLEHPDDVAQMNRYEQLLDPAGMGEEGLPAEYLPTEDNLRDFENIYGPTDNPNERSTMREHTSALDRLERQSRQKENKLPNGLVEPSIIKQMIIHSHRLQRLRTMAAQQHQQRLEQQIGRGIPV